MNLADTILARVHERRDELLSLARQLVRIPSENPPGREADVAQFLSDRLAGLATSPIEVHAREPGRPNLLARVRGSDGPGRLMLVAHMDTKPVGDRGQWTVDPFAGHVAHGQLYGRGAADMKAAIAAMVVAAEALKEVGFPGKSSSSS